MALTFDVSKVANYQEVTTSPFDSTRWHPVTEYLINVTMVIDMGKITADNCDEFASRVMMYQMIAGAGIGFDDGMVFVTKDDVKAHIGLTTNVSTTSKAAWAKRIVEIAGRRAKRNDGDKTAMVIVQEHFDALFPKSEE